jgi:hypothetical protein
LVPSSSAILSEQPVVALLAGGVGQPVDFAATEVDLPRRQVELRDWASRSAISPCQRADEPPSEPTEVGPRGGQPNPVVERIVVRDVVKPDPSVSRSDSVRLEPHRGKGLIFACVRPYPCSVSSRTRDDRWRNSVAIERTRHSSAVVRFSCPLQRPLPGPPTRKMIPLSGDFPRSTGASRPSVCLCTISHGAFARFCHSKPFTNACGRPGGHATPGAS